MMKALFILSLILGGAVSPRAHASGANVLKFGDSRKPIARISFNFSMAPFPRLGYVGTEDRQTDGLSVCRLIPSQF
jgi:hypothetical protein